MLFLALLGGFPLDAVRYSYSLFHRLASVYFSLDVLAKRGFACRFDERHDYFFLPIGVGFIIVVVRMICGLAGILTAGRPPALLVVPSRRRSASISRLLLRLLAGIAAFLAAPISAFISFGFARRLLGVP